MKILDSERDALSVQYHAKKICKILQIQDSNLQIIVNKKGYQIIEIKEHSKNEVNWKNL